MQNTQTIDYLFEYISKAPLSLALLRAIECRLLSQYELQAPVLDLGCGDGVFSSVFFKEPVDLGVDINGKEIARCEKYKKHKTLLKCDADNIPVPNGSFKTVFSNGVIEHIPHYQQILKEVSRVLEPNGTFIFTLPGKYNGEDFFFCRLLKGLGFASLASKYVRFVNDFFQHHNLFTKEEWKSHLNEVQLDLVEAVAYANDKVSVFHELTLPLSVPATFTKKFLGRWVFSPRLRSLFLSPLFSLLLRNIYLDQPTGSSLLLVAKKRNS